MVAPIKLVLGKTVASRPLDCRERLLCALLCLYTFAALDSLERADSYRRAAAPGPRVRDRERTQSRLRGRGATVSDRHPARRVLLRGRPGQAAPDAVPP